MAATLTSNTSASKGLQDLDISRPFSPDNDQVLRWNGAKLWRDGILDTPNYTAEGHGVNLV